MDSKDSTNESSSENAVLFEQERLALNEQLNRLTQQLIWIDRNLDEIGRLLRISQPPMYEKWDIRWWKTGGQSIGRTPQLIKWVKAKRSNRFKAVSVQRVKHIRSDGGFAVNHTETVELVRLAQSMLSERDQVRTNIGKAKLLLRNLDGRHLILDHARFRLNAIHWKIVTNLIAKGYNVEEHLLPEGYFDTPE